MAQRASPYLIEYFTLDRTILTDAENQEWDYRFDDYGNLWRILDPFGHNRRMYWSDQQDLLYVSEGFGTNLSGYIGPKDSPYNRLSRSIFDGIGNQTGQIDANGITTQMEYDADSRLVTVTPARATYQIGGNWFDHFGKDGFVMCSALDDSSDLVQLPSYVDSAGILPGESADDSNPFVRALPDSVTHRLDTRAPWVRLPGSPTRDTFRRTLGLWKPEEESASFTFRIPVSVTGEFNLSFYSHSADQEYFVVNEDDYEQCYAGSFGRDVEFLITDFDPVSGDPRRQVFRLPNNAAGCWVTFGVYAEAESEIRVLIRSRAEVDADKFPVINCIAFDPPEQRTTNLFYTGVDLTSVVNPLNQATMMEYNGDGTLKKVTDAKARDTEFFYEDDFKNLTKITDAALGEVVLEYDDNGNLVRTEDQDTRVSLMEYDGKNRLVKVTDPLSHATEFTFDPAGNLVGIQDARGRVTTLVYNSLNRLTLVSNALGQETLFQYNATGRLTRVTDALGRETHFSYDEAGRLVETELPDQQRILYALNAVNRLVSISGPNASQEDWDAINLVGAVNVLDDPSMEAVDASNNSRYWRRNEDWDYSSGWSPSTAEAHSGTRSLLTPTGGNWRQFNLPAYAGGRYVAKAWAKKASSGASTVVASIAAEVRNFQAVLETQTDAGQATVVDTNWTEIKPQVVQIPGDTQSVRTQPPLDTLRFKVEKTTPLDSSSNAYLDDASLQLINTCMEYDGENLREVGTADGARFRREFDRVGRLCRLSDPQGRVISLHYDGLDRVVAVSDSLGLTLRYTYDETGQLSSFTDAKNQVMAFAYDELDRLLSITYPDTTTEEFEYTPAGDLLSYTDNNNLQRTFDYDHAHRLIGVTYPNTETLVLAYDEVNNLVSRTERNGDSETYQYDKLNRVERCVFVPEVGSDSPAWDLTSEYDEVGNRTELAVTGGTTGAFYGSARYGTDYYGESLPIWKVPEGGYDEMNRLVEFQDSQEQSTTFGYDVEGRRTSVSCPNGTLTEATYDIVGKLLSLRTTLDEVELLKLDYGYNLASDRLALQTDKAAYTYHLDKSGRLVEETINRWVTQHIEHLAQGELQRCQLDFEGARVQLLSAEDDFGQLNVDRWEPRMEASGIYISPPEIRYLGNELRADQGLHMIYPSVWTSYDYPLSADTVGYSQSPKLRCRVGFKALPAIQDLKLRRPLLGDFDLVLDWECFEAPNGLVNTDPERVYYPQDSRLTVTFTRLNGTQPSVITRGYVNATNGVWPYPSTNNYYFRNYWNTGVESKFAAPENAGKFRLRRVGSNFTLSYWDEGTSSWAGAGTDFTGYGTDPLLLKITGYTYHGCMNYSLLSLTNLSEDPVLFQEEGIYLSSLFDAGRTVVWERISWDETLPTNTDVEFQVAFSNDREGPWSYIGPDGTSGTVFTTAAGEDFDASSDFEGRYARFKAVLSTSDGLETPSFGNVHLSFSGEGMLASEVRTYQYDEAGNIEMVTTVTDAGSSTDARTHNDLNQITEQVVGGDTWTFSYDDNGNMTGKTDGTDTWTYTFNDENRLTRVQGPGSVDVHYSYDSIGRMLTRDDGGPDITQLSWDGWNVIREVTGEFETIYHIPEGQILSFVRDGVIYQVHSCSLGSIRMITNEAGEVLARYDFDAWGRAISVTEDSALAGFPMRFVGSLGVRFDELSGLYYMRNRWYETSVSRFLSRDPLGIEAGANLYSYCQNNPVRWSDPSGLETGEDDGSSVGIDTKPVQWGPMTVVNYDATSPFPAVSFLWRSQIFKLRRIGKMDKDGKLTKSQTPFCWELVQTVMLPTSMGQGKKVIGTAVIPIPTAKQSQTSFKLGDTMKITTAVWGGQAFTGGTSKVGLLPHQTEGYFNLVMDQQIHVSYWTMPKNQKFPKIPICDDPCPPRPEKASPR